MDESTRVIFTGCVLKPTGRGAYQLQHSARATLYTELDEKGLEFLLHFAEPASLVEAIAHFRDLGWELPDADYQAAFEQLTAGLLLVPASGAAAPAPAPASAAAPSGVARDAELQIADAGDGDAAGVAALRNQLYTNLERTLHPEDGPRPVFGAFLESASRLSFEGRGLLFVLTQRALAESRGEPSSTPLESHLEEVMVSLVPLASLIDELRAAGFVDDGGALLVPPAERLPIFALLREELFAQQARPEWRPGRAEAQAVHLVARRGDRVAGYLRGLLISSGGVCQEATLEEMVVSEGERGRGTGSALVAAFQRVCRDTGAPMVNVPTQVGNTGAIRFYERAGFELMPETVYLRWTPGR
jgi:GNAT superfamily N-acetyltransferase